MLMVTNILRQVVALYPAELQQQIEVEMPKIALESARLGMEGACCRTERGSVLPTR
jgi:hypothetical protein